MKYRLHLLIVIISVVTVPVLFNHAFAEEPDVQRIVDRMDKLYRSDTSHSELEMTVETPNWERTLRMKLWTEGMDKTFIRITYPRKDAGIATLRERNEMWNYFPKINKVMKVPPSMMMSSWMGSDFTNDDIVKESSFLNDYHYKLISPEGAEPDLYYIELLPRKDSPIVWGKIVFSVRKEDYIPVKEEFYDERGRMTRVMEFKDVKELGGRTIPSVMELKSLAKEGRRTIVRYKSAEFDKKLPRDTFSLRNLQRRK